MLTIKNVKTAIFLLVLKPKLLIWANKQYKLLNELIKINFV